MTRYLYGTAALCLLVAASVLYGEHLVQVKWDSETARREAVADQERIRNSESNEAIEAKHKKDIEHAKSQAGRAAVAAWLKSHGLLPDGSPVSGSGGGQTDRTGKPDGTPDKFGTGDNIEEFAKGCALDALQILRWQEWAVREGLTTEP